jgi:hypothetical protein
MKRAFVVAFTCLALAGCQSGPATDPFLRTRVPPEGTGSAAPPVITPPPGTTQAPNSTLRSRLQNASSDAPEDEAEPVEQTSIDRSKALGNSVRRTRVADRTTETAKSVPLRESVDLADLAAVEPSLASQESDATESPQPKAPVAHRAPRPTIRVGAVHSEPIAPKAEAAEEVEEKTDLAVVTPDRQPRAVRNPLRAATAATPKSAVKLAAAAEPVEAETVSLDEESSAAETPAGGEESHSTVRIVAARDEQPAAAPAAEEEAHEPLPASTDSSPWRPVAADAPRPAARIVATGFRETPATASAAPAGFAYDPNYRWLRGKLERSRSSGQWKLRYIPIDGQTDRFGGSVVLESSEQLESLQSGEWVTAYGQVAGEPERGFAPTYRLERIELAAK